MADFMHILLILVLAAAAIHLIVYTAKNERIRVIEIDEDFTVRYPRIFLYICVIFFLLTALVVVSLVLDGQFSSLNILFVIVFSALTLPFLLLSTVWKIEVRPEYLVYVSPLGIKRQIYYKDISSASLYPKALVLATTLKNYRIFPQVTYREYFLKRLAMNGVAVQRYQQ